MNWLWFLLIGWWLAPIWFCIGLLLSWNPAGWAMVLKTPEIMFGGE